jgi:tetratricopeptide (TPR) repeat protein
MTNKEIEKYLMGEMDPQSEKEFEKRLKEDNDLKEEYELQKEIENAVGEEDIMNLRGQLETYAPSEVSKRKFHIYRAELLSIAAGLTLFIGVGLLMMFHSQLTQPEDLYNSYFEAYPSIYSQRSVSQNSDIGEVKQKAFLAYEKENWQEAKQHFTQLLQNNPENAEYSFYMGVLNLKLDHPDLALKNFQRILEKEDPLFEDQSIWYSALGYLKKGNIKESVFHLNKIVREDMAHKEKASELLKKLE